jgi:hypothetical protein
LRVGIIVQFFVVAFLLFVLPGFAASGCNSRVPESPAQGPAGAAAAERVSSMGEGSIGRQTNGGKSTKSARRSWHDADENWLPPLKMPGASETTGGAASAWARGTPFTEEQAIECIERELAAALKVRPTLAVWLFDQSAAAGAMRRGVAAAAMEISRRLADDIAVIGGPQSRGAERNRLSTAIVAFGSKVHVLTSMPITDPDRLPSSSAINEEPAAATQAYAAVSKAAELFAQYRTPEQEVIFVLVAHSAVADEENFVKVIEKLNAKAIPVYGIGPAAPFGRLTDALTADLRPNAAGLARDSLYSERIKLFFTGNEGDAELTDSGYGPFHLERLCRATHGACLRLRADGSPGWATDVDGEIKPALLRRYAPDYVSEQEYHAILTENRACQALHEAAQLPPARVLVAPTYDFRKQEEAALSRALSMAQRASAENQSTLERLQQTLAAGEPDRPRLNRPRWQAAFDLAYGRACAARARNDGYNHMLALLKNGKTFANPQSTTWSLRPAEGIQGRSDLDTMARKAKMLLERVVHEHPGTPWAAMAARELQTPCGWEWTER